MSIPGPPAIGQGSVKAKARIPKFKFQLYHFPAVFYWTSGFTIQCLSFLICKMRVKSHYFVGLL